MGKIRLKYLLDFGIEKSEKIQTFYRAIPIYVVNIIHSLTAALKDYQRLETPGLRKKDKEPSTQAVVKSVAVSISADAKMQLFKDTLK